MNKYSVPFDLIGEKVNLRLTKNAVEVFYRGTRVAMHARHRTVLRDPVVKPEHMTPEHRKYLNYNESEFTSWAALLVNIPLRLSDISSQAAKKPSKATRPVPV